MSESFVEGHGLTAIKTARCGFDADDGKLTTRLVRFVRPGKTKQFGLYRLDGVRRKRPTKMNNTLSTEPA